LRARIVDGASLERSTAAGDLTGNGSLGDSEADDEPFRIFMFAIVRVTRID
jgi:hypothetical protein